MNIVTFGNVDNIMKDQFTEMYTAYIDSDRLISIAGTVICIKNPGEPLYWSSGRFITLTRIDPDSSRHSTKLEH